MNLKVSDAKREEGFTLIELLVVVIIIGILAAIAIPVFLNQRQRAWERTAESDVRNAAIAIETVFTDDFVYPDGFGPIGDVSNDTTFELVVGGAGGETGEDITISPLVDLTYATSADDQRYCISASHANITDDPVATYHSAAGGLVETPATCNEAYADSTP